MLNEQAPDTKTRLASVALQLKSLLSEVEALSRETKEPLVALPDREWLPALEVARLYGFRSPRALSVWAKRHGLPSRVLGRQTFFSRSDLDTLILRAPTGALKTRTPKPEPKTQEQSAAQDAVLRMVKRGGAR